MKVDLNMKLDVDDWNGEALIIGDKHFDLNVWSDMDDTIRVAIYELEKGDNGYWTNTDKEVYQEDFEVGIVVDDNPKDYYKERI
jgi:hypothetical protein